MCVSKVAALQGCVSQLCASRGGVSELQPAASGIFGSVNFGAVPSSGEENRTPGIWQKAAVSFSFLVIVVV